MLNAAKDHALKEVRIQIERHRSVQKMGKYAEEPFDDYNVDKDNDNDTDELNLHDEDESESPAKPLTNSRSFIARIRLQSSGSVYSRRRLHSSSIKKSFSKSFEQATK